LLLQLTELFNFEADFRIMNKLISFLLLLLFVLPLVVQAQDKDTVWVNTLNFSDITKRKGTYEFPPSSDSWQKIKMHYTLKCDPQTKRDGFNCGEWDYLSYIIVHDSTGKIDSNALEHSNFTIGDLAPDSFLRVQSPMMDTILTWQYQTIVDQVNSADSGLIGSGISKFSQMFTSPRSQYLFTAAELQNAGLNAGDITSISLNVNQVAGTLKNVSIRLKSTLQSSLTRFIDKSSSLVFEGDLSISSTGIFHLENLEPFYWDGTSNVVLEVAHNDPTPAAIYEIAGDVSISGITSEPDDLHYRVNDNSFIEVNDATTVFKDLDSMITISFWAKGGERLPSNSSILEARNSAGNRVINIHMPWSNSQMYWDAGNNGGSYDRINKAASNAEIKDKWNHWAFVKNVTSGEMKIYLNGELWHSGTGKSMDMKGIELFRIGKGTSNYQYYGDIDRLSIWKTAFSLADVQDLMWVDITTSHSNYSDLLLNFDFDNFDPSKPYELVSAHPSTVTANIYGQIDIRPYSGESIFFDVKRASYRPLITLVQADQLTHQDSIERTTFKARPWYSIALFEHPNDPTAQTGFKWGYMAGSVYSFNSDGSKKDSSNVTADEKIYKTSRTYYTKFEVINNIEIGRYITPYGIGFDLGPDGFRWEYDVTDYNYLLSDRVTLTAGNQQELIDLKFEFIKGTPSRDVKEIAYYANRESRTYNNIAKDVSFKNDTIDLHPDSKTYKLVTRITGHGQNSDPGKNHCCEWADKTHYMKVDGKDALQWDIWQNDKCALNPLIDQGGNWAPPRAGWCPGAPVDDYNFDITPFISGNQVSLNYEIEPVPTDNLGQGAGRYVVSFHLIEYGEWHHQNDASVTQIIRPTNWEFHRKQNPTCATPRITIKNTGSMEMTSALIRYGVENGNPIVFGWTGKLAPDASESLDLPFAIWDYLSETNSLTFYAEIVRVNGKADEDPTNSRASSSFTIPKVAPTTIELWFRNNSIPDATVRLTNDQGKIIYEKLDGAPNVLNRETLNLDPGCYKLVCETENEFGLYYPLIPAVGNGLLRLSSSTGFLQTFNPNFGKSIEYYFTVAYALNNEVKNMPTWTVYPNPSNGLITIETEGIRQESYDVRVLNTSGQVIYQTKALLDNGLVQIDIGNEAAGIYFVKVNYNEIQRVFKVVKN
jgi:Concanavalin A-like lectin/glucanases superfamily/Peptide-N-glycosidase F, C terminal/Secretion system C-terminal sorting domain